MFKTYAIVVGLLLFLFNTTVQTQTNYFERTYERQGEDHGMAIKALSDGGYAVFSFSDYTDFQASFHFMKIDQQGEVLREVSWGEARINWIQDFELASDGGYMVVGGVGDNHQNMDAYIARLDPHGLLLWEQQIDMGGFDLARSICKTANGQYLVVGVTDDLQDQTDVLFIRISEDGTISIKKTFDLGAEDSAQSIRPSHDGNLFIVGNTGNFTESAAFYMRTDQQGNILWQKTLARSPFTNACAAHETDDKGFIVVGEFENRISFVDVHVTKMDSANNIEWSRVYSEFGDLIESMSDIKPTDDGGFIMAGQIFDINSPTFNNSDVFLVKLDSIGRVEWSRTMGTPYFDAAQEIEQTEDGGYVFVGVFGRNSPTKGDIYVVKTDASGLVTSVQNFANDPVPVDFLVQNYPNPFNPVTTIQFNLPTASKVRVTVVNASGQFVEVLEQGYMQAGLQTLQWHAAGHATGIYYVVVEDRRNKQVHKMTLVK